MKLKKLWYVDYEHLQKTFNRIQLLADKGRRYKTEYFSVYLQTLELSLNKSLIILLYDMHIFLLSNSNFSKWLKILFLIKPKILLILVNLLFDIPGPEQ